MGLVKDKKAPFGEGLY